MRESKHCIQQKQEQTYQLITKQNEKGIHNKLYLFPRFRSYFHQPRKKKTKQKQKRSHANNWSNSRNKIHNFYQPNGTNSSLSYQTSEQVLKKKSKKKSSILPGSKLWLKAYKMASGAIHINIDAMKNFFTTAAIVILFLTKTTNLNSANSSVLFQFRRIVQMGRFDWFLKESMEYGSV